MTISPTRSAGIGGVLAFTVWLLQPLAVFWLLGDEDLLSWASLERTRWLAPYETATFLVLACGMFLLVHGIDRQLGGRNEGSPLAAAGRAAGHVGVVGWLLLVVVQSALFSSASSDLEDMALADQASALAVHGVVAMAGLHLAVVGGALWLLMIGTHARARGVVGRPTAYAAIAGGCIALTPFAVPFSPPWGALAVVLMALWLGIHQLRASRSGAAVPAPLPRTAA